MATRPRNQLQMETLSTALGKKATPTKPSYTSYNGTGAVPKMANPYIQQVTPGSRFGAAPAAPDIGFSNSLQTLLGLQMQQGNRAAAPSLAISPSYESDPVLARINALKTQNVNNARSEAAKLRNQAIIDTGLDDVGGEIGLDASTLEAARQNPFSERAKLRRTSQERGREMDEYLNREGNLFYSGHRANQLSDLARNTAEAETGLTRDIRSLLSRVDEGVLTAEQAEMEREREALEAAAEEQRWADMLAAINGAPPPPTLEGYADAPTPAQVETMTSMGIDPATAIYAPQQTMISGPNAMPEMFGGEAYTVPPPGSLYNYGSLDMIGDPYAPDALAMQLALLGETGYY